MGEWRPDPLERARWRWYDGVQWTDHTAEGTEPPVGPPSLTVAATPPDTSGPGLGQHSAAGRPWAAEPPAVPRDWLGEGRTIIRWAIHHAKEYRHDQPRAFFAVVGVVAVLAAVGVNAFADRTSMINGTFQLNDSGYDESGIGCAGRGGYSDIRRGTDVTVRDGTGRIIGSGALGFGVPSDGTCGFSFWVEVPRTDFYEIEVGRRGSLTYTRSEMVRNGWEVGFTLGD